MTTKTKVTAAPKAAKTKATAFKLIEGAAAIQKGITSIATRGKKFDHDVHILAVSCLNHADKHGDITLAQKLVDSLPASQRKNALRDWFISHGKFKWNAETKALAYDKAKATLLPEAIAKPFWEFVPEKDYVPFDIIAALRTLQHRAVKAIEKGENVDKTILDNIAKLIPAEQPTF